MLASIAMVLIVSGAFAVGCSDDDNRKPTAAEGAAADARRQQEIDKMPGLTPEQKAIMKAKMGGPQVAMPGDDVKQKSAGKGR